MSELSILLATLLEDTVHAVLFPLLGVGGGVRGLARGFSFGMYRLRERLALYNHTFLFHFFNFNVGFRFMSDVTSCVI